MEYWTASNPGYNEYHHNVTFDHMKQWAKSECIWVCLGVPIQSDSTHRWCTSSIQLFICVDLCHAILSLLWAWLVQIFQVVQGNQVILSPIFSKCYTSLGIKTLKPVTIRTSVLHYLTKSFVLPMCTVHIWFVRWSHLSINTLITTTCWSPYCTGCVLVINALHCQDPISHSLDQSLICGLHLAFSLMHNYMNACATITTCILL